MLNSDSVDCRQVKCIKGNFASINELPQVKITCYRILPSPIPQRVTLYRRHFDVVKV